MNKFFWRSLTMAWVIIFVAGVVFLQFRVIDATGVLQTTELRMLAQLLWLAVFLVIAMLQLIIWMLVKRK
ncbi:hypothetical protein CH76_09650 [Lysinibacillus sp. BF-4]|uniref:DUF3923 family protein n=1 Tax=Lysinibacillus sp. BF-4 TaxID=1473546 RepID=UPI000501996D|nr:DUF3923 family protein [Lysinibacillus sp. BF-4]KFL42886.1 hypothetical protein CH76_09650 [Lysinibacillus sp. BF-4]